jgi:hypothetical protein
MRSTDELDIETSIANGAWSSSERVNKMVDKAYTKSNGLVLLFFSVIKR